MSHNHPTEESFLKDVAEHQMEILLDNDVYRHVRFARPDTNCYSFNLLTGPGFLLCRGDMGCFEFERVRDMFGFFRFGEKDLAHYKSREINIPINLQYWSGKLEAVNKDGGFKGFSTEKFERRIKERFVSFVRDRSLSKSDRKELRDKMESDLLCGYDNPSDAFGMASCFSFTDSNDKTHHPFQDFWDYNCDEYTYHFVWCCYAISWGIMQYDAHKAKNKEPAEKACPLCSGSGQISPTRPCICAL